MEMATALEVEAKIDAHIDVCAVRYEGIAVEMRSVNARLKRLEGILVTATGAIILLLLGLVMKTHL
jgi:hypothetical protein